MADEPTPEPTPAHVPAAPRPPRWSAKSKAAAQQHLIEAPSDHVCSPLPGGKWKCDTCDVTSDNFTPAAPGPDEPQAHLKAAPPPAGLPPALDTDVPVHVAWARVMTDVRPIGKDSLNKDQNFAFRGIDATVMGVKPWLAKHGVVVLPLSVELLESERYQTKNGAHMHGMVTRHNWLIVGPRGDTLTMQTLGQAADSGDKVASKAASVAFRTSLLQGLAIPTGDPDPDASSHERGAATEQPAAGASMEPDSRQEGWAAITARGRSLKLTEAEIRADYLASAGHEIDGQESTVDTLRAYYTGMGKSAAPLPSGPCVKCGAETSSQTARDGADVFEHKKCPEQSPTAEPDAPAAEPTPTPEPEPAPAEPPAAPATADPRTALWTAISDAGKAKGWTRQQAQDDFTDWAQHARGVTAPLKIDGPMTTNDHLVRYHHAMATRGEPTA